MPPPLLLVLFVLLPAPAAGHQNPTSQGSSALSEWRPAKASYYAADPEDAVGTHQSSPFFIHRSSVPKNLFTGYMRPTKISTEPSLLFVISQYPCVKHAERFLFSCAPRKEIPPRPHVGLPGGFVCMYSL
jgi:hypothetical protein